ncbi:hypothetical protein A2U01_0038543 [Trifolium medium]|uniref:Uncharacterized protein n=1 Tax=Trifolium medium TaxID=97028 RepID=A0A392Q1F6_9FABA|nr:hypothetical protein [Trifolium medium]
MNDIYLSLSNNSVIPNLGGPLWLLQLWLNAMKYFQWFLTLDSHHPNFSFFSQSLPGLDHLRNKSLFAVTDKDDIASFTFWRTVLTSQYIVSWVSGTHIRVLPYQPHLFARQFDLSQMLQTPLSIDE